MKTVILTLCLLLFSSVVQAKCDSYWVGDNDGILVQICFDIENSPCCEGTCRVKNYYYYPVDFVLLLRFDNRPPRTYNIRLNSSEEKTFDIPVFNGNFTVKDICIDLSEHLEGNKNFRG